MQASEKLNKLIKRSSLNSNDVIELLASHDTLTKKLTFDYLVERSSVDQHLSLLTANLLLRDCNDANPCIRSGSILALSCLPEMENAAVNAIHKSISDDSPQVRRITAHACIQLNKLNPKGFSESGLIDRLYEGIRDPDPIVVSNCLLALNTTLRDEGGVVINKNIAHHLYSRLGVFSQCNIIYILTFLKMYNPKTEDEMLMLLNHLDILFSVCQPAILTSTIELFFHLTGGFDHLTSDMLDAITSPICKILSVYENVEGIFLLLEFIQGLKVDLKSTFGPHYKYFFLRTKDPSYLKSKKLETLALIADESNINEIISEVKVYISDYQSFTAAFKCLSILGSINTEIRVKVMIILTPLLKNSNEQTLIAALDCLFSVLTPTIQETLSEETITDALIHSVAPLFTHLSLQEEHPHLILNLVSLFAPFLDDIKQILDSFFQNWDKYCMDVQCQIMRTSAVSFLASPGKLQYFLSSVLSKGFRSNCDSVVKEAAFIYSALELGPAEAKNVLSLSLLRPNILKLDAT